MLIIEYSSSGLMKFNSGFFINYTICFALALLMALSVKYSFNKNESQLKINCVFVKILNVLSVFYILLLTSKNYIISVSALSQVTSSQAFSQEGIEMFILIVSVICALCSIEPLTRTSFVCLSLLWIIILLMCLISYKGWDYENIAPILGNDIKSTFLNFGGIRVFSSALSLYIIKNLLKKENEAYFSLKSSVIKTYLIGFVIIAVCTLSIPYPMSKLYNFSLEGIFSIAKSGVFFHRFEILLSFSLVIISVVSVSLGIYLSSFSLSKLSALKDTRAYCIILGVVLFYFKQNYNPEKLLNSLSDAVSVILYAFLLIKSLLNFINTKKVKI